VIRWQGFSQFWPWASGGGDSRSPVPNGFNPKGQGLRLESETEEEPISTTGGNCDVVCTYRARRIEDGKELDQIQGIFRISNLSGDGRGLILSLSLGLSARSQCLSPCTGERG
jgi:hypothetical protein